LSTSTKAPTAQTAGQTAVQDNLNDDVDDLPQASDSSTGGSASKLAGGSALAKAGSAQSPIGSTDVDPIAQSSQSTSLDSQNLSSANAVLQASATAFSGLDPALSAMSPTSLAQSAASDSEPARVREGVGKTRSNSIQGISSPGQLNDATRPTGDALAAQAGVGMHQGHASRAANAGSGPASSQATAQETFTTLDSGTATQPSQPSWLHAGSHTAEAGFVDPSLGWVGVRAEMSGGVVHASVVPGSTDAAATLGGHMPGLNNYLGSQQSPVASLTLASPAGSDSGAGSGSMQQGTGHSAGQDTGNSANRNLNQANAPVDSPAQVAIDSNSATLSANLNNLPMDRSASRISVMA
jgi:hypothetical protein